MGRFLIVSKADRLKEYQQIAEEYAVGFELNDFYDPAVLDDQEKQRQLIELYQEAGLPEDCTMHGAFFDIVLFSWDPQIRRLSELRMEQSMMIAKQLGVRGVVFHTNCNPMLSNEEYDERIVSMTSDYLGTLLRKYPDIEIYLENMFDADPVTLAKISERLCMYENYGVCLDYAHASISKTPIEIWVRTLSSYIKHIHINDNDLERDLHLALGIGKIDWNRFAGYYISYLSQCSVLIETTDPEAQRSSLQYLEQTLGKVADNRKGNRLEAIGMENKTPLQAEELLEKIFYYMNQLVEDKEFSSTILLLTELGKTLVNSERASFWYWDKKNRQYWTIVALGSDRITVSEGVGVIGASIQNNETIVINDPYGDERFNPQIDKESGYVTKSILCMPVTNAKGEVIGAYQAINKLDENGQSAFDERDVKRLTLAAVYCGKTLESYLLYNEVQIDPLTGLKNRRGFYEYYENTRRNRMVSVIMCDIDFFKKVNDTYGHNAGDTVLVHIAGILKNGLRHVDEVIRWGGEEFVLLLADKPFEQVVETAETLRGMVASSVCYFEEQAIRVTISCGVQELNFDLTADENIKSVDAKLYEAKITGRNRVVT